MEQEYDLSNIEEGIREELTEAGIKELKTPEEVDAELGNGKGTVLVYVNSMCGCGAMTARPGLYEALMNEKKPERLVTVFAGKDIEATERAREYFAKFNVEKASPSFRLFKDGKLVFAIQREEMLHREPEEVTEKLVAAFNEYC